VPQLDDEVVEVVFELRDHHTRLQGVHAYPAAVRVGIEVEIRR